MNHDTKRIRNIPFLSYLAWLVAGILLRQFMPNIPMNVWVLAFALSLCFWFITSLLRPTNLFRLRVKSLPYYFVLLVFGGLYTALYQMRTLEKPELADGTFTGIVTEILSANDKSKRLLIRFDGEKKSDTVSINDELVVLSSYDSLANKILQVGNRIMFTASLKPIVNSRVPGNFDYQQYMRLKGVRYQAVVYKHIYVIPEPVSSLRTKALVARGKLLHLLGKIDLNPDELGVLAALTLGERTLLSGELRSSFAASGAMHVLAVSGLHVGIISVLLGQLLGFFKRVKNGAIIRALLIIGLLWAYAFITGLSPSVMRAATMFSFVEIGRASKQRGNFYNTLAASAFLLILIKPFVLFEVGFQLSYLAVAGIVFFQPRLASIYKPGNKVSKWIWDLFTVSLAAQLATTPISLYYFHQFPVYFWVSNFFVIPAAIIILYAAVLYLVVSPIPFVSLAVGFVLKMVVGSLVYMVKLVESFPGAVLQNVWISFFTMLMLYLLLISFSASVINRSVMQLKVSVLVLIVLFVNSSVSFYLTMNQQKIIVYNTAQVATVSYIKAKNHYYFTLNDSLSGFEQTMLSNVSGYYRCGPPIRCDAWGELQPAIRYAAPIMLVDELVFAEIQRGKKSETSLPVNIYVDRWNRLLHIDNEALAALGPNYLLKNSAKAENSEYIHDLKNDGALVFDF